MTGRSVPEWQGATPDTAIPRRVRARVFESAGGCCQICTRKLRPGDRWDCDHIVALANGGMHAESNLQVACGNCHKDKTARDVAEKARTHRIQARHAGIKRPSSFACSKSSPWKKKINGTVVPREGN